MDAPSPILKTQYQMVQDAARGGTVLKKGHRRRPGRNNNNNHHKTNFASQSNSKVLEITKSKNQKFIDDKAAQDLSEQTRNVIKKLM